MFVGEWEIKSTTKLAVKEAAQYRDELISTAFPWSRSTSESAEQKTPAQQYVFDSVKSIAVRCAAHFFPMATTTAQSGETSADSKAIRDEESSASVASNEACATIVTDAHRDIAALWAPLLFTLITEELPEATLSSSKSGNLVEKSILRSLDATGRQVVSYQANGVCLSFMMDGHHSVSRPHQPTLFFYLRVRYLLEKLLVRLTPKLLASATAIIGDTSATRPSSPASASQEGQGVARMRRCERRLRRHLHHALYVNVILTRPFMDLKPKEALSLPTSYSPVVAVMAANEQATQYVLENRTLMGPGVGCLRLASTVNPSEKEPSVAFYSKHFIKDMPAVIVAPAQSFPFATGTIAADLYSSALHRLKRARKDEKDDSFLFYFGENHSLAREESSTDPKCLGVTLFANDIEPSTGLRGHAFEPIHTAFDGLWELFWPSYSSSASRIDGVKGDWLVPDALQTPEVQEAEEVMFSPEAVQGAGEGEEAADEVIDLTTQPLPAVPQTMDECLMFALAESLKELHQRQKLSVVNTHQQQQAKQQQKVNPQSGRGKKGRDRVTTSSQQPSDPDQALKVPIISVVGLYLKRHSPRIPMQVRPVALGGKDRQTTEETAPPAENNETPQPFGGSDDDEEEGHEKLSKAEKMAKRRAEKESKLAEKKGGKSKGKGKNDKSSASVATLVDGGIVDGGSTPATAVEGPTLVDSMTKLAINLDFKHSTFKKSTSFFKEMAAKTNSAFFTVPNENEIHVRFQKHLLLSSASSNEEPPLDLLRDHKKRYGAFISRFHAPLLELEEERRAEEEFAAIGGGEDSSYGARGGQETLEDEAKATVSSISQFYGFTNSVNDELKRILTGRWRPASEDSTKQKTDEESSSNENDTESDDDSDDDEDQSLKSLLSAASQLTSVTSAPEPIALHPLIGSKGKPVYNKAALLRNLRYYVIKRGLFYGDDLPSDDEDESQNVNSSAKKNTQPNNNNTNNNQLKTTDGVKAYPSLGSEATPNNTSVESAPVWQRALLRREAERTKKESEEAAAAAEAKAKAEVEERKQQESESNQKDQKKEKKKGPPKVHLDELLTTTMRVSASDRVMDMAAFFQAVTWRLLMPQTRIVAQNPHRVKTLWIKTTLPTVLIKERKRQGNRTVVYVVGIDDFGLSLRALAQRWKKEMACSVACEGAPPALGHGTRMCLALTGKVAGSVEASLLQLGIPPSCITSR